MTIERWNPPQATTTREQKLLLRTKQHRKLIAFLRNHRHELFDAEFQDELAGMYRETGAGREPVVPALMAMAVLLQGYERVSDAEAVERTIIDLRWQMVLDRLGNEEPAFSQGAFQEFRQRMIRCEMDRRLLERTVELARRTEAFDFRKLPKSLRVAMDSMPRQGPLRQGSCRFRVSCSRGRRGCEDDGVQRGLPKPDGGEDEWSAADVGDGAVQGGRRPTADALEIAT